MNIEEVIKKGLEGYPVKLRKGLKAYIRYKEDVLDTEYPLMGYYIDKSVFDIVWTKDGKYPIIPFDIVGLWEEPLEFEHWGILNESIKYIAKDEDGNWCAFVNKPQMRSTYWWFSEDSKDSNYYEMTYLRVDFPDCGWKDSLIERPKDNK